jgi:DNA-binding transcriptional LysR family regulator
MRAGELESWSRLLNNFLQGISGVCLSKPVNSASSREGKPFDQPVSTRLTLNSARAALDAALANLGVARVLSYQAADALAAGRLKEVLSDFAPAPLPVNLAYSGQGMIPFKTRCFIEFAVPRVRRSLAGLE